MKKIIRDYLTFNKRERNGVFVLLAIIVMLITYLNVSHLFIKEDTTDFTKFEKEATLLKGAVAQENNYSKKEQISATDKITETKTEYFNFDPNNLPDADWKKLGLTDKQIHTIKNYEAKGGKFRTKEDVKKMYCISEKLYSSLEPYIQIEQLAAVSSQLAKTSDKIWLRSTNSKSPVEINSADSAQLEGLKGIGAFYAKTIIKYRTSLGGFVSKEQLMEVWKLDQEKFDKIKDLVTVDNSAIKKININTCTASNLKHPYLKWNAVNAIVNYRDKHGKYKTVEEIKKTDLIDDETFRKIAPYLIVE
jgi:competence protein ComEA